MREIKFRAWEIKRKIMVPVDTIEFPMGGIRWYGPGAGKGIAYANPDYDWKVDSILMQYADLKDKNGEDYCEDDIDQRGIIKYGSYQASIGIIWDTLIESINNCIVAFDAWRSNRSLALASHIVDYLKNTYGSLNHGWYREAADGRQYGLTEANCKCNEIIGNIHENPELLKEAGHE